MYFVRSVEFWFARSVAEFITVLCLVGIIWLIMFLVFSAGKYKGRR
jgi:hypothetical protein